MLTNQKFDSLRDQYIACKKNSVLLEYIENIFKIYWESISKTEKIPKQFTFMLVLRWRERKAHLIYKPKNKDFESISQNRNSLKIQI